MPLYEFNCQSCHHDFEVLMNYNDKATCPKCQSAKLHKKFSMFATIAKGSVGGCDMNDMDCGDCDQAPANGGHTHQGGCCGGNNFDSLDD